MPSAFGSFYSRHVEALTGSTEDAKDPNAVARVCYVAAIVYGAFVAFCGLQVSLNCFVREIDETDRADDGACTVSTGSAAIDWVNSAPVVRVSVSYAALYNAAVHELDGPPS